MDGSAFPSTARRQRRFLVFAVLLLGCAAAFLGLRGTSLNPALDTLRDWGQVVLTPVRWLSDLPEKYARMQEASRVTSDLETEYERLRRDHFSLKAQLLQFEALREENARLRRLLGATSLLQSPLRVVDIARRQLHPYTHRLILAAGHAEGLRAGQAVLDESGILGQIESTSEHESLVVLATEAEHAIPAIIERDGTQTISHGLGQENLLQVSWLPQNADIRVGDRLLSSGLGGRYPAGYPLAVVSRVSQPNGERFLQVFATPLADASASHEVVVVLSAPRPAPEPGL